MSDTPNIPLLPALIELSKVDIQLAILSTEKKKVEADLLSRSQMLQAHVTKREVKARVLTDKQGLVAREEKAIKFERDKINDRRRALSTLGSYKLQQAAEREIMFVSKEIGKREDLLLGVMRDVEILEKEVGENDALIAGLKEEFAAAEREASEDLKNIDAQLGSAQVARSEKAGIIGQGAVLTLYNRVRDRFPSDPVVQLVNRDTCGGCHIRVGPQAIVQLSRGDVLKCQGCGRILRLPDE
jgi:predicted  nucleic acid-binding Zn-ribbon protein